MNPLTTKILFISTVALFVVIMSSLGPEQLRGSGTYEVRVVNGFSNNSSLPLVIWCSSSDGDDMGGRALQEGDDFGWRLETNIWSTAHYKCTMKWDNMRRSFDAIKLPRDVNRCSPFRKCSWLVKEDGFYFSNDDVVWKKDFSWHLE